MNPTTFSDGPGALLAFLPAPNPAAIAAHAVAFANADGGTLVIGLDKDGTYTGPVDGAAVSRALRVAASQCQPLIPLESFALAATPHGPVITLPVARSKTVHALADGRVLIRTGGSLPPGIRVLTGDEIRTLVAARSNGDFEAEIVPGAKVSDLDPELLADFMVTRARQTGRSWRLDAEDLLIRMGAVTAEHAITVAGMLLFGRNPQRWLPDAGVRLVRFVTSPASIEDTIRAAVDREVNGPLVRLLAELSTLVEEQMRRHIFDGEPDRTDYPPDAVREALINAVLHRDYRLRGERVTVCIYPDHIDITSPGGLPGYMTTAEHLLAGRYSRNPRLSAALLHWGRVPQPGRGLWSIIDRMDRSGHRPPEIEAGSYTVMVRLYSARAANPHSSGHADSPDLAALHDAADLTVRQREMLTYVQAHGSITFREMRTLCEGVRDDVLQTDLADLLQRGLLRRVGSLSKAYYIFP